MTVISVDSIRNMPIAASYGPVVVIYFIAFALMFLLPASLASAELTSVFPNGSGIYTWVKEGINKPFGMLAIWLQWAENIFYYPQQLIFIFLILFYVFGQMTGNPTSLDGDTSSLHIPLVLCGLLLFLVLSWLNGKGLSMSVALSNWMTYLGLVIPIGILCVIFIYHIITFGGSKLLPIVSPSQWGGWLTHGGLEGLQDKFDVVLLSYTGVEIATVHTRNVQNPRQSYPRALLIAALIIMLTQAIGSLAIYLSNHGDMVHGDMKYIVYAFSHFFETLHLTWLTPLISLLIAFGLIGGLSNWILAPSRGLKLALEDQGLLPLLTQDKTEMPRRMLWFQAGLVTALSMYLMLFQQSYLEVIGLLIQIMAFIYLAMYLLMFVALARVCVNGNNHIIPFGRFGVLLVALSGICVSMAPIVVYLMLIQSWYDALFKALLIMVMFIIPLGLSYFKQKA